MARSAPTIPIASASGERTFSISDSDWSGIEKVFGHSLSGAIRQDILRATESFVYFEIFERTAEPLAAAIHRVEVVKKAAGSFHEALFASTTDARIYADHLIKKHFVDPRLTSGDTVHHLAGVLTSLSVACHQALREMHDPNHSGHREGECWNQWILRITAIAKAEHLPTAASKGSDKNQDDGTSAFVLLVHGLQMCVPKGARRHTQSYNALAAAIHRARSAVARKPPRDIKPHCVSKKMSRKKGQCAP